jgi:hypothetical protein
LALPASCNAWAAAHSPAPLQISNFNALCVGALVAEVAEVAGVAGGEEVVVEEGEEEEEEEEEDGAVASNKE